MSTAPLNPRPQYASARACRLPGKSTNITSAIDPKMVNSGVCDPPSIAKLTAAAVGTTTAARNARRSASCSGSRARHRFSTWRNTAVVSVANDLELTELVTVWHRGEPAGVKGVKQLPRDPLQGIAVPRQSGLLVADQHVYAPRRERLGLPLVLQDLECRLVHDVEALLVHWGLHRIGLRVDRTPPPDRGFGAVRQRQPDLDEGVDASARVWFGTHRLHYLHGAGLHPVRDEFGGVGPPAGEVVIEGPGCDTETVADRGQLQAAVAQIGQHVEPGFEVNLPRHDARHGSTLVR